MAEREITRRRKPTHAGYIVIDPKEGSDMKAQWFEIGTVRSHGDGSGFDVSIPAGVSVTGHIGCRRRKEQLAK
jgi:hypothetical protein